ncbi:MAG: hypothetical protein WC444_04160 [Candidatus Paceibacterota bacterium]
MKRKDLHDGMHVVVNTGENHREERTEAYIVQNGGWAAVQEIRKGKTPAFKTPVTMFENPYTNTPKYFVCGEGLPHVAIAVLHTFPAYKHAGVNYPEQTLWIPMVVAPEKVICTWKRHLEKLEEEKKRQEEQKNEAEKQKLIRQEKEFLKEKIRRGLYDLGLRKIQFPGLTYDESYDDEDSVITEENDIILDMYELKVLLDKIACTNL